jgi:GntR family transcriptional regulator / MocR family aminotransferase
MTALRCIPHTKALSFLIRSSFYCFENQSTAQPEGLPVVKKVNNRKSDPAVVWEQLLVRPHRSRGAISTQLVMSFIDAINSKQIPEGVRIPSSRSIADSLRIGRNTAIASINSLIEQGYLVSKDRSGVFVAVCNEVGQRPPHRTDPGELYDWSSKLRISHLPWKPVGSPRVPITHNFKYGQFDPSTFPTSHWRLCERSASGLTEIAEWGRDMFDLDDAGLIDSLRRHVLPNHGIWAEPDEILVTLGGQEGRYIVAQLLAKAGVTVGLESPGLPDMNEIISATAAQRIYLPLDRGGILLSAKLKQCDVTFLTPGHHCPTTAVMPHERRLALLRLAGRRDMVLVEDTYETELISHGRVTPSLKSLDREGRVIHIGSLSKSVAPGLRVGFVVAAPPVIAELRAIRRLIHRHPPGNIQRALAMFIDRGYYHSYLRRVSIILQSRTHVLRKSLSHWLPEAKIWHCDGASSFWVELPEWVDATALCVEMEKRGILIESGDRFFPKIFPTNHLRIGVSQIQEDRIESGIRSIRAVMRNADREPSHKSASGWSPKSANLALDLRECGRRSL